MFENRSESERKKIFWLLVIGITLVVFIVWIILLAKGFILNSSKIAEKKDRNINQQNIGSVTGDLKSAINEFNKLDVKGKISDIKNEFSNLKNNQNQNQNIDQSLNINESVNQKQVNVNQEQTNKQEQIEEPTNQSIIENLNSLIIPRLPVE